MKKSSATVDACRISPEDEFHKPDDESVRPECGKPEMDEVLRRMLATPPDPKVSGKSGD
jgi:hypothetical protein